MSAPFRVLHVVASLQGGAAWHVVHLSTALKERGHASAIAAPYDNPSLLQSIREREIPFYNAPLNGSLPIEALFKLRSLFDSEPWTHVHLHGHRAALIGRIACALMGNSVPVVYTVHGYHPPYYPDALSRMTVNGLERLLSRLTDGYVCVSESTKRDLIGAVPSAAARCAVVENAVPVLIPSDEERERKRAKIRKAYGIPQDAFLIGSVGRLQWQKSVSRLMRAFRILHERREDFWLLIVGDGPKRDLLETLSESLQVNERCLFTGHQANPADFYAAMDVFVLPSLWEGLPLTVLEAQAAGTITIATDVPGSRDAIEDAKNGYLSDNTVVGIAKAVERVRKDIGRAPTIRQNARDRLAGQYTLKRMVDGTESAYRNARKGF